MRQFSLWFLEELPGFLMSEPMCYFVGLAFLIVVINVVHDIISIK